MAGTDDSKILELLKAQYSEQMMPILIMFIVNEIDKLPDEKSIYDITNPLTGKHFSEKDLTSFAKNSYKELKTMINNPKSDLMEYGKEDNIENPKTEEELSYVASLAPSTASLSGNDKESIEARKRVANFQKALKFAMKNINDPPQQLSMLNRIQKTVPFLVLDPHRKKTKSVKYGYADLLRFMCDPVKDGSVLKHIQNNPIGKRTRIKKVSGKENEFQAITEDVNNPFYQPIRYPIPDEAANLRLKQLQVGSREFYAKKMKELEYLDKQVKAKGQSKKQKEKHLISMLKVLKEVQDHQNNPILFSKYVKGQERPMETYRKEHFFEMLSQLSASIQKAPATMGVKVPEHGVVEINPDEYSKSVPIKRRGSSKKGSKPKKGRKAKKVKQVKHQSGGGTDTEDSSSDTE